MKTAIAPCLMLLKWIGINMSEEKEEPLFVKSEEGEINIKPPPLLEKTMTLEGFVRRN